MSDKIHEVDFERALGERYLSYALSTIISRSLPDVRDGLKPVHRRLIYAMQQLRLNPNSPFKKSARVVGDVMGKFHPHGDIAIYDALVRLAQNFSVRYPLIEGQGNFGTIDGDNAAAMRYTEARLTDVATALMEGIDENAIDFRLTYDGESREPTVFPAAFPNLLANGATGIAVGMATSIPPHNVAEICCALRHLIEKPEATVGDLIQLLPAPDFPTGGVLIEHHDCLIKAYETGRGSFRLRAKWEIEQKNAGLYRIIVSEIPFQVNKSKLIEKIATLLIEKKFPLLNDIQDESADDIRIVLEPKNRNVNPEVLMESLFQQTDLETRVSLNMNVLDKGHIPRVMSLKEVLQAYLNHRKVVLTRRTEYRLTQITQRLELLQGYLVAYLNVDEIIKIIRDNSEPKHLMKEKFALSEQQVEAIWNMRLQTLHKLQEAEIQKEYQELIAEQETLTTLLVTPKLQWKQIKDHLKRLEKTYGLDTLIGKRRTVVMEPRETMIIPLEEGIEPEDVTIICSARGWIRTVKGHQTQELKYKEGDEERYIIPASTRDKLLILTSHGRFYTLVVDKLPRGRGKGDPIRFMIEIDETQEVLCLMLASNKPDQHYLLASSDGRGFIVEEKNLLAQTRAGKQVMTLAEGAQVIACLTLSQESNFVLTIGDNRKILAFPLLALPIMSRGRGVKLQKYRQGNLSDITVINETDGLKWERSGKKHQEDLSIWRGQRGSVGRFAPVTFPRTNKFEKKS